MSESLIRVSAPTIFATHFIQLVSTLSPYEAVAPLHLAVKKIKQSEQDEQDDKYRSGNYDMDYSHTVVAGSMKE